MACLIMTQYFVDYFWKDGRPHGKGLISDYQKGSAYKIVSDPYFKWISIEEYQNGSFHRLIYDSSLLKFNHLKPANQTAWEKRIIEETAEKTVAEIRNQDDRLVYVESYFFKNGLCFLTEVRSPHGLFLATHEMHYETLGNTFNGVILKDSTGKAVMMKRYSFDEETFQFTDLLEENWDLSSNTDGSFHRENRSEGSSS